MKHYFKNLKLKEDASQEEIQAAYDKLSKELDPKNNDNQEFFVEEFKKVQEAYEALSNSSILATEKGSQVIASKNKYDLKTPNEFIENKKNKKMFTYIFNTKRNILTFVILAFILKLVLHFFIFPETEKVVNYDKKIYTNTQTRDYYTFNNDSLIKNTSKNQLLYILRNSGGSIKPTTKNGQEYIYENRVCDTCGDSIFYYPKEIHFLSFRVHIQNILTIKPYIFFISICILLLLVILFNDKIKAR